MGYITALAIYLISLFLGAGRTLDQVCSSLGLASQSYAMFGRQYRGAIRGWQVSVDFMPARGIAPSVLNIRVRADMPARIAIGHQTPLLDCAGCPALTFENPELGQLIVLSEQEALARSLLGKPAARAAVQRLMNQSEAGTSLPTLRELYLQPDQIWFRTHPRQMGEDQFRAYILELIDLAEAAAR
jgi:hypothetical protein